VLRLSSGAPDRRSSGLPPLKFTEHHNIPILPQKPSHNNDIIRQTQGRAVDAGEGRINRYLTNGCLLRDGVPSPVAPTPEGHWRCAAKNAGQQSSLRFFLLVNAHRRCHSVERTDGDLGSRDTRPLEREPCLVPDGKSSNMAQYRMEDARRIGPTHGGEVPGCRLTPNTDRQSMQERDRDSRQRGQPAACGRRCWRRSARNANTSSPSEREVRWETCCR